MLKKTSVRKGLWIRFLRYAAYDDVVSKEIYF